MSDYAGQAHEETVRRPHEVELHRIDPVQAGKISGLLYAGGGLVIGPFIFLVGGIGVIEQQPAAAGLWVAGLVILALILVPALYAVMGFFVGMIAAFLYNFIAGWIGGLRVQLR